MISRTLQKPSLILASLAIMLATLSYVAFTQERSIHTDSYLGYKEISSDELNSMMADKDFLFINVHIPYEGEIKGTDVFVPYDGISNNLDRLPADKNAKIVVYCMSGRMSSSAARELAENEYTNIYDLNGGMIDWWVSGYNER